MEATTKPTADQWKVLVKEFEQSLQSQSQFCRENELVLSQFTYYLNKFRTTPKRKSITAKKAAQFSSVSIASASSHCQVSLPNGIRIAVPPNFEIDQVSGLIESLL